MGTGFDVNTNLELFCFFIFDRIKGMREWGKGECPISNTEWPMSKWGALRAMTRGCSRKGAKAQREWGNDVEGMTE